MLDDYHLIQAPAVHQSLGFLIDYLPPQLRLAATGEEPYEPSVGRATSLVANAPAARNASV